MKMLRNTLTGAVHRWSEVTAKVSYMEEFEAAKPKAVEPEVKAEEPAPKKRVVRRKKKAVADDGVHD